MARKTKLSAQEVSEMDEFKKSEFRKGGLNLISEKDRGWSVDYDATGRRVAILWHTDRKPDEGEAMRRVPEGQVVLEFEGKSGGKEHVIFDADKLKRAIRWA